MHVFGYLRLRSKLLLIVSLAFVSVAACIGIGASLIRQRMVDDRISRLHSVVT